MKSAMTRNHSCYSNLSSKKFFVRHKLGICNDCQLVVFPTLRLTTSTRTSAMIIPYLTSLIRRSLYKLRWIIRVDVKRGLSTHICRYAYVHKDTDNDFPTLSSKHGVRYKFNLRPLRLLQERNQRRLTATTTSCSVHSSLGDQSNITAHCPGRSGSRDTNDILAFGTRSPLAHT